jgi:hypothetical protein
MIYDSIKQGMERMLMQLMYEGHMADDVLGWNGEDVYCASRHGQSKRQYRNPLSIVDDGWCSRHRARIV